MSDKTWPAVLPAGTYVLVLDFKFVVKATRLATSAANAKYVAEQPAAIALAGKIVGNTKSHSAIGRGGYIVKSQGRLWDCPRQSVIPVDPNDEHMLQLWLDHC